MYLIYQYRFRGKKQLHLHVLVLEVKVMGHARYARHNACMQPCNP